MAVDAGSSDHLRAVIVRPQLAAGIHQGDEVELTITPFLGFVRSAKVAAAARPLPPPEPVSQLPGPKPLPPVHWTERPGAPGVGGVEDEGPRSAADVPAITAALARQLQRLLATKSMRR